MLKLNLFILFLLSFLITSGHGKPRQLLQKPSGRIIGGEIARAAQFPFSASIYISTDDGTYFCSGALIDNEWVLTSGQCVDGGKLFTLRLGSNSLTANDASLTRVSSDSYFLHPDFNPETLENDVGLIKLRMPITYSDYIQPINYISEISLPDGAQVTTTGWGQISDEAAGLVDELNYVHLVTLSNEECKLAYGSQVTENMLCVEGNYNEGTCKGDLGSPLILYGSRGYTYHVGISSFISTNGCESTDPSGFTRTAPYREWIRNITSNN
ncbi:brachyurin-like [Tenebrio molitor]|uniref:brachyurin-like n=1 Tax=Tenebrio molitor TaxID=7067 RepID=UPI0036248F2B